jgi:hypothetical protein
MRARTLRGIATVLGFGPRITAAVLERPDGLLLDENLAHSLFPLHLGMSQYWRDFETLERWTRTLPHRGSWQRYDMDTTGTAFWHETYFVRGGMEAIYVDEGKSLVMMRLSAGTTHSWNTAGRSRATRRAQSRRANSWRCTGRWHPSTRTTTVDRLAGNDRAVTGGVRHDRAGRRRARLSQYRAVPQHHQGRWSWTANSRSRRGVRVPLATRAVGWSTTPSVFPDACRRPAHANCRRPRQSRSPKASSRVVEPFHRRTT